MKLLFTAILVTTLSTLCLSQIPEILSNKETYLPDFSYAGYHNGLHTNSSIQFDSVIDVTDHGILPNDGKDDSKAMLALMDKIENLNFSITIQFPPGRFIFSEIIYLKRSNLLIRGSGSGPNGTMFYYPRPMKYLAAPPELKELRKYLVKFDKQQREKENNIDLPFSQYAWSGGFIWAKYPDQRVKSYLPEFSEKCNTLTTIKSGKRGRKELVVSNASQLRVDDVVQIEWFNKEGEQGSLIKALYGDTDLKVGSHHWSFPDEPLVKQQVRISAISGTKVSISSPLLMDIKSEWHPSFSEWKHLEEVGIEGIRIEFPMAETIAHHVEEGFNGIYFTRVYDGWIKDVVVHNADAAILTEESANLTIDDIVTSGPKLSHYSVYVGGVHNVLVNNLNVYNEVRHPLSFNTFSTKNVFKNCEVFQAPILDQHSGANHQNLFDNVKVHVSLNGSDSYGLFAEGGAGYWKPSHGAYNTFWNIEVHFLDGLNRKDEVILNGMNNGPNARLIGVHGNLPVRIQYGPDAYIEMTNEPLTFVPSLYNYQLEKRR